MQENCKNSLNIFFLYFRKVLSLRNPLHVLHPYFAPVIVLKLILLKFVEIWFIKIC